MVRLMTTYKLLDSPYWDVLLVLVCVAVAYFARRRLRSIGPNRHRPMPFKNGRRVFALSGLAIFFSSFVWCAATLAAGLTDVGIVLVPTLVLVGLGWVILIANSTWAQEHTLLIVILGIVGIAAAGLWLFTSAGTLSQSDPHNFYLIFYPPIAGVTAGILAIATPAFRWFFRMTGVIVDQ
jgi:hypothetical protein